MHFDDIRAVEEADRDYDAETREDIRRFRSGFGLPVDDALVEHFLAEYKAERQEPGMWLTAEEWERYEDQDRLQNEARTHGQLVADLNDGRGPRAPSANSLVKGRTRRAR